MSCRHPLEELQRVYEGSAVPRTDRMLCGLCGELQYLAVRTPGQALFPMAPQARADVNRWMFWSAQHFQPAVSVLRWEHQVKALIGLGRQFCSLAKFADATTCHPCGVTRNTISCGAPLSACLPSRRS